METEKRDFKLMKLKDLNANETKVYAPNKKIITFGESINDMKEEDVIGCIDKLISISENTEELYKDENFKYIPGSFDEMVYNILDLIEYENTKSLNPSNFQKTKNRITSLMKKNENDDINKNDDDNKIDYTSPAYEVKIKPNAKKLEKLEEYIRQKTEESPEQMKKLMEWLGELPVQTKHIFNNYDYYFASDFFYKEWYDNNPDYSLKDLLEEDVKDNFNHEKFDVDMILWKNAELFYRDNEEKKDNQDYIVVTKEKFYKDANYLDRAETKLKARRIVDSILKNCEGFISHPDFISQYIIDDDEKRKPKNDDGIDEYSSALNALEELVRLKEERMPTKDQLDCAKKILVEQKDNKYLVHLLNGSDAIWLAYDAEGILKTVKSMRH